MRKKVDRLTVETEGERWRDRERERDIIRVVNDDYLC